jgi:O-antigen ligase
MDLGMKSSFVILPTYFLIFRPKLDLQKLFRFFLYGSIFSLVVYAAVVLIHYSKNGLILTGSDFCFWMHRGYYATYLTLAFTFLLLEVMRKNKLTIINALALILLFSGTLISESKAGILIIFINSFILIFYFLKVKFGWLKSTFIILTISLITLFSVSKLLDGNNRFSGALYNFNKENIDVTSLESTTARILMWETSIDLITDNVFTGVGTGDIKEELQSLNYEKGYTGVAEANLNAHNQFLNSWTALGLFGFISLISVFLTLLVPGDPNNIFFIRLLSLSFFLVFLTESFLEVQAGIIPFAFLICCIGQSKVINRAVETLNHD